MSIEVVEVKNKKDLKKFITFPGRFIRMTNIGYLL